MLYEAFAKLTTSQPDARAIETPAGDTASYGELSERADRIARALASRGVTLGTTIAGSLENSIDYSGLILATCQIGAIYVPVSRDLNDEMRDWSLSRVEPALVVVEGDRSTPPNRTCVTLAELAAETQHHGVELAPRPHAGRFRMLWTSGSTGAPRLVAWRQDNLLTERQRWLAHIGIRQDDVIYCRHTLDVAHGMDIHMFAALLSGARLVLGDGRTAPEHLLEQLAEHRVNLLSALPRHYEELTRAAQQRGGFRLPDLRLPLCGGAYLSSKTVSDAVQTLGIHIRRIYGSTEFGMAFGNMDDIDQTYAGMRPIEGVQAIIESMPGKTSEIGELIVRSRCTSEGYVGDEDKNKQSFRDGWYYTGDVAQLDKDGQYRILGRTSEAIAGADGPVFAPQLEAELADACPAHEVVVLAAHTEAYKPEALVLARAESEAEAEAVRNTIVKILHKKQIHGHIKFTERIPHIPVGKADKNLIRQQW